MSTQCRLNVDELPLRARPVMLKRRHVSSKCGLNVDKSSLFRGSHDDECRRLWRILTCPRNARGLRRARSLDQRGAPSVNKFCGVCHSAGLVGGLSFGGVTVGSPPAVWGVLKVGAAARRRPTALASVSLPLGAGVLWANVSSAAPSHACCPQPLPDACASLFFLPPTQLAWVLLRWRHPPGLRRARCRRRLARRITGGPSASLPRRM